MKTNLVGHIARPHHQKKSSAETGELFLFWPRYIILHKKPVFSYDFSRKKWLLNFHKTLHNYLYRE